MAERTSNNEVLLKEMASSKKPFIADFYDNSFYNSETIWQFIITPSLFYSDQITAGERYTFTFCFKSNIDFNFLDITLIDHSPEANFFTILAPPSRQFPHGKANTEYKGSVTFTALKSATSAVPHANVLQLEMNADKSTQPTLTFTKFEIIKVPVVEIQGLASSVPENNLTVREQDVLNLLLAGSIPKEIATALNISYATVLDHQKKIYRKLDVHNINELLIKYSAGKNQTEKKEIPAQKTKGFKAVFLRWDTFCDSLGSSINFTPKVEKIQDNYTETFSISGNLLYQPEVYAGSPAYPDHSTLEAMRNMKSLSFMILGDGKAYELMIATSETVKAKFNHYRKIFTTENGIICEININIDELSQATTFGNEAPFVRDHIEYFQINPYTKGEFNLKFWDIRFY